jgi:hypothetical protein
VSVHLVGVSPYGANKGVLRGLLVSDNGALAQRKKQFRLISLALGAFTGLVLLAGDAIPRDPSDELRLVLVWLLFAGLTAAAIFAWAKVTQALPLVLRALSLAGGLTLLMMCTVWSGAQGATISAAQSGVWGAALALGFYWMPKLSKSSRHRG